MNLPNKLTLLRLILVPVMMVFFYIENVVCAYLTVVIFLIASFTDFLDGHIARKYNLVTNFGKFMDPLADKALVLCALILIVDKQVVPITLLASISLSVMLIRELVVSGLRLIGAEKGVVIAADKLGKLKTVVQIIAISLLLLVPALFYHKGLNVNIYNFVLYLGIAFLCLATIISVISGASYIIKNINVFKTQTPKE